MDNKIKRILCDSAENELRLIKKDDYVSYYRKGGFFASEKQKREKRGEAYAFITSNYCRKIE